MKPKIYVVRHGKTKLNNSTTESKDMIRGHMDVPLDEEGLKQANDLADEFEGLDVGCIYTSDLQRAYKTAEIINNVLKSDLEVTNKLRPWDLGTFQGKVASKVSGDLKEYSEEKPDEAVPKGESFNSFLTRYKEGLDEVFKEALDGEIIMIVSHYRNVKVLEAWIANGMKIDENDIPILDMENFNSHEKMDTGISRTLVYSDNSWNWE